MLEHLFTWYGMGALGLVALIMLVMFAKVMGFVWRIVFIILLMVGAFFYVRHLML